MKTFGIGLALFISGLLTYLLANLLTAIGIFTDNVSTLAQSMATAGTLPQGTVVPEPITAIAVGLPQEIFDVLAYIGIAVMAFGAIWYWFVEPLMSLLAPPPPKKETLQRPMSQPGAPRPSRPPTGYAQPQGRDLEAWIQDAIREKMDRERGH